MKVYSKLIMTGFCCFFIYSVKAQTFPDFKPLRYDEDYRFLQKDTTGKNWYKKLKYASLSERDKTYIGFGGDVRFQYFYVKNEKWGDVPKDNDGYVLGRYLFHADFHACDHFRTFVQLQSSTADSKIKTTPVDQNPLEVHQVFVDVNVNSGENAKLTFRLGRQEFSYGSQRIISVRDGPNNRQSFDAARIIFKSKTYQMDAFYSHYVAAQKGVFDDGWNKDNQFWGGYMIFNNVPVIKNADVYYVSLWKRQAIFNDGTGSEMRHSIGTRLWGKYGDWQNDAEALYQFGTLTSEIISAWTASVNTAYKFDELKYKPQIGLKTELISGDRKKGDGKLQTFNPLFPRGGYFGLAAFIGPSDLFDIHPSVSFEITRKLNWNVDQDFFWRYSRNDGIYAPNASLIYSGKNMAGRCIGQQLSTDLVYLPETCFYLRAEFTWFKAGEYLKVSGSGKDILFTGITAQVQF